MRDTISHKRKHLMSPLFSVTQRKKKRRRNRILTIWHINNWMPFIFLFLHLIFCVYLFFSSKVLRRRIRLAYFFSKKMLVDLLSESNQHGTKREKAAHHLNRKNKLLKGEDISSQKGHPILWFDTSSILFYFFVCPRFFCFIASPVQPIFLGFSHFKNFKFPSQLFLFCVDF